MKLRTANAEKRLGVYWLIAGAVTLAGMFALWWLVEETNKEGTHNAELLPLFALVPLLVGASHLFKSRFHHA